MQHFYQQARKSINNTSVKFAKSSSHTSASELENLTANKKTWNKKLKTKLLISQSQHHCAMIEPNFTSTDAGDYERNLKVKEEPFEEHYLPESVIETATDLRADEGCCLCPEGTRLQILLYEHIQKVHLDEGKLNLTRNRNIRSNSNQSVSALSESRLGVSCCFCSDGLSIQTELINHLLSHFVVKCEVDSIHIETNSSRSIEHDARFQRTREKFEEPKFTCNLCMKQFQYKQGLKRHMKNEHSLDSIQRVKYQRQDDRDGARVNCEFCPKVFKYKQGAQKHWDLEHNPINAFPCPKPECSSRCKTLKNLHAHLRTHEPPRPAEGLENLQCHKCLKVFPSQKQLSLHFYTHREKFFCCDICGSKFNNREQIKNHVMRHVGLFHKKVFHQRIICDQCSMMVYSHKMKRHKLIHHSDEKPFRCDFSGCDAAFSDTRILSDHKNIHLRLKPYKCEYCTEAFRSGANLRLHRIRHTDPER